MTFKPSLIAVIVGVVSTLVVLVITAIYDYYISLLLTLVIIVASITISWVVYAFLKAKTKTLKIVYLVFLIFSCFTAYKVVNELTYSKYQKITKPSILIIQPKKISNLYAQTKLAEAIQNLPKSIPWSYSDLDLIVMTYSPASVSNNEATVLNDYLLKNQFIRSVIMISEVGDDSLSIKIDTPSNAYWRSNAFKYVGTDQDSDSTSYSEPVARMIGLLGGRIKIGAKMVDDLFQYRKNIELNLGVSLLDSITYTEDSSKYNAQSFSIDDTEYYLNANVYYTAVNTLQDSGLDSESCRLLNKYIDSKKIEVPNLDSARPKNQY